MAHFAKIENNIVVEVLVVNDAIENRGTDFLANDLGLGGTWIQTSYNTVGNQHKLGGTPLRGNFAGIGYTYDHQNDVFYAPQPYASWTLNQSTWLWEAPTPRPQDGKSYKWDEPTTSWVEVA